MKFIHIVALGALVIQMTNIGFVVSANIARAADPSAAVDESSGATAPETPHLSLDEFISQSLTQTNRASVRPAESDATESATAPADANPLFAWDRTPNTSWSHGQISGYYETEDIPFKLELGGLTNGASTTVHVRMEYRRSGVVGFEQFRHPNAPVEPGLTYNADRTNFTMGAPVSTTISGVEYKTYAFTFTPIGTTATLYWDALIALGAHNYSGASLSVQYTEGVKNVPIAVNQLLFNAFTIGKYDTADPIALGATTQYHIQFVNTGNAAASNVVVTDTLPSGLAYVSTIDADGGTVAVNGQVITLAFASVAQGDGREIIIEVRGTASGTHTNTASVISTFNPNPTSVTEDTTVYVDNPPLGQTCGLDIGLIVDTSGSVDSTEMGQMKTALKNFALAFTGTPTVFSLTSFSTDSIQERAFSRTPTQVGSPGGDIDTDIPNTGNGWTNWDAGLARSDDTFDPRPTKSDLIVIATDGSPNRFGYPTTDPSAANYTTGLTHAIERANIIKTAGTRIVVIGIGEDSSDPATPAQKLQKMINISGPIVATTPAAITTSTDVIKVTNFTGIGTALASYASQLCGGKILVQKQFDTNGDGIPELNGSVADPLLAGWNFDVNGSPSDPAAQTTTNTGSLEFSNVLNGTYSVVETALKPDTALTSAACLNGADPIGSYNPATRTVSGLVMGTDDNISCTFVNSATTGSITVNKLVDQDGNGTFETDNAGANTLGFRWGLDGNANDRLMGSTASNVLAGAHAVNENSVPGYHFIGWYPESAAADFSCTNPYHTTLPASTTVTAGANQIITLCNARDTGTITVNKKIDANGDGTFEGGNTEANALGFDWGLGGVTPDRDMGTSASNVATGSHAINESLAPNYHFTGWYPNISPLTPVPYSCANPYSTSLPATVNVTTGATTSITLCNARDTAGLTVLKAVDTDGDGDVDIQNATNWTWDLDAGNQNFTTGSTQTVTTGTHQVSEDNQGGYHNISWSCWNTVTSDPFGNGVGTTLDVTVPLDGATCLFTNAHDAGTITINKDYDDDGNGTVDRTNPAGWTWDLVGGTQDNVGGATLALPTALYTITEDPNADYASAWTCSNQTSGNGTSLSVLLESDDQNIVCTFRNTRQTGSITVNKLVDTNGDGTFEGGNTEANALGFDWGIDAEIPGRDMGTTASGVPTGAHTVNEDSVAGYHFVGWYPNVSSLQPACSCSDPYSTSLPANLTVSPGQTASITLCNARDTGTLTVIKHVINDNGGSKAAADFTMNVTGGNVSNPAFAGSESGTTVTLNTGSYNVDENAVAGYTKTLGADCSGLIANGEHKTCTVTNDDQSASLTVIKHVINDNGGSKAAADFTMNVTGGSVSTPSFPGSEAGTTVTLNAGSYSVDEIELPDYAKTLSADCSGTIANGESKTCTVTNDDRTAHLTLVKNVVTDNGGTAVPADWLLSASGPTPISGQGGADSDVNAGTYTLAETGGPNGYAASAWNCSGNIPNQGIIIPQPGNQVTLNPGESVTCTITNDDIQPKLTVTKVVSGGSLQVGDFPLFVDSTSVTSGVQSGFNAGSYLISETNQPGYTGTITGDCDANGNLTLNLGDVKSCTITNIRDTGTIRGTKFNDRNGDGVWDASEPGLAGVAINLSNGWSDITDEIGEYSFELVPTGTYTVSEVVPTGWLNTTDDEVDDVVVNANQETIVNFGNFEKFSISGQKFNDLNYNQVKDGEEPGLSGWTIEMSLEIVTPRPSSGHVLGITEITTITGPDGNYSFPDLGPGTYRLTEHQQDGWVQTTPNPEPIVAQSGKNVTGVDFGNFEKPEFSIEVSKTDGVETTAPGSQLTYTINWSITSFDSVPNVMISDTLPSNVRFISSPDGGVHDGSLTGGIVTWNLGDITPTPVDFTATGAKTVVVEVLSPLPDGTVIWNSGWLCFGQTPTKLNGESCVPFEDTTIVESDFSVDIEKSGADIVNAGANLTYTLTWSVLGDAPVDSLIITDVIPADTTYVSADCGTTTGTCSIDDSGSPVIWNLGARNPGDSGTVTLTVQVASPLSNGTIIPNEAELCGTVGDIRPDKAEDNHCDDDAIETTVSASPIIAVVKSDTPDPVQAGANLTYTLDWTVTGNSPVTNLVITDPIPANTTFVSAANSGAYDAGTKTITWNLGNHLPGDTGSVSFIVTVASPLANGTQLANTATIDSAENEPVSDTETTTVASTAVLALTKGDSPDPVAPGASLTYTLNWSVTGNSPVTALTLTDTLPAELTFVSASNGGTHNGVNPGGVVTWNLGNHVPGDSGIVTVVATVGQTVADQTVLTNTATLDSTETDSVTATEKTTVIGTPKLEITKAVDASFANPSGQVTYTVIVKNTGTATALNVTVNDVLPDGFVFADTGLKTRTFTVGDLSPNGSQTLTYKVVISTSIAAGTYKNVATAKADNHDPVSAEASLDIRIPSILGATAEPKLELTKAVDKTSVLAGGTAVYTLTVKNTGDAPALNVKLIDLLPQGFTLVDDGQSATKTWYLGDLLPNHKRVINVEVKVATNVASGKYTNTAEVTADNHPPVQAKVDIQVKKGEVLGLATTGAGLIDLMVALASICLIGLGLGLLFRRRLSLQRAK